MSQDEDERPRKKFRKAKGINTRLKVSFTLVSHKCSEQFILNYSFILCKIFLEQSTKDCGGVSWVAEKVLCQRLDIPEWVSHNVKNMMDEGCTVPFIAR